MINDIQSLKTIHRLCAFANIGVIPSDAKLIEAMDLAKSIVGVDKIKDVNKVLLSLSQHIMPSQSICQAAMNVLKSEMDVAVKKNGVSL